MIDDLQDAILNKDAERVVRVLSQWDEEQRTAAAWPFNVLVLALGFEYEVVKPCTLELDSPEVIAKRERDRIQQMSRRNSTMDYDMSWVAGLAAYGLYGLADCARCVSALDYEALSAQVMADRKPSWWDEWYREVTGNKDWPIDPQFWAHLYERGMVSAEDFPAARPGFADKLPEAWDKAPEAIQMVLQGVPDCRDLIYELAAAPAYPFNGAEWVPIIKWLSKNELLDSPRLFQVILDSLHAQQNQTVRNAGVMMAKAAGAKGPLLAEFQAQWLGLVADSQAVVAGFAVQQLNKIADAGLLDTREACAALPAIFTHKPKTHALTAIRILERIADDSELRSEAMESTAMALMHPNKDVQSAALELLEKRLTDTDSAAIDLVQLHENEVSTTLRGRARKVREFETDNGSGSDESSTTPSDHAATGDCSQSDPGWFTSAASALPADVAESLRISNAIEAAHAGQIDSQCLWDIRRMPILETARPLPPIENVEELIDVTAAAVEKCECGDTAERIACGIAKFCQDQPAGFDAMTRSLGRRACRDRPDRGLTAGFVGAQFAELIRAWLDCDEPHDTWFVHHSAPLHSRLNDLTLRVKKNTAYPLISEATHCGGWIDPHTWVERLAMAERDSIHLTESDVVYSCLRLMPDDRPAALKQSEQLGSRFRQLANVALGSDDITIDASWTTAVWIAAFRARDPQIILSRHTPDLSRFSNPQSIRDLPDVIYPSSYQWKVKERATNSTMWSLVAATAMPLDLNEENSYAPLIESGNSGPDLADELEKLSGQKQSHGPLTAEFHGIRPYSGPAYTYPYLASLWPMELDWYWNTATHALSLRVESRASVEDPFGHCLLPLLETDRPLTTMSARALWIATVAKDESFRAMATEVWIALAETDRADVQTLQTTLLEVMEGGWVKLNRIGELLSEVAAVSPLHAWVVASVLESFLVTQETMPRNAIKLLEPLDECCELLGRAVTPELHKLLQSVKSGKAKTLARSLLQRESTTTPERTAAINAALEARLQRAQRMQAGQQ